MWDSCPWYTKRGEAPPVWLGCCCWCSWWWALVGLISLSAYGLCLPGCLVTEFIADKNAYGCPHHATHGGTYTGSRNRYLWQGRLRWPQGHYDAEEKIDGGTEPPSPPRPSLCPWPVAVTICLIGCDAGGARGVSPSSPLFTLAAAPAIISVSLMVQSPSTMPTDVPTRQTTIAPTTSPTTQPTAVRLGGGRGRRM